MSEDFLARLAPLRQEAESYLSENLVSELPAVQQIGRQILLDGGKRLRPILYLLALRLCGDTDPEHGRYSSIFEFMHGASLLHDDVIDEAETRRGRKTAHQEWGNRVVILVGDHLFGRAFALSAKSGLPRFVEALAECTSDLAEGQVLEAQHQFEFETPYEVYLKIITAKTAVLLAAATRTGAIMAGAEPDREDALYRFGLDLGVAFQIIDDVLDWAGDEAVVGKPLGQDIREGKATLPWIRALERADEETRQKMLAAAGQENLDAETWTWLKGTVEALGGVAQSLAEAEALKDRAKARLEMFAASPERELLLDLADYVCRRRF